MDGLDGKKLTVAFFNLDGREEIAQTLTDEPQRHHRAATAVGNGPGLVRRLL